MTGEVLAQTQRSSPASFECGHHLSPAPQAPVAVDVYEQVRFRSKNNRKNEEVNCPRFLRP